MIRRIESADRADYIKFAKEFYTSDAVTHDVPEEYLTLTFETLVEGNPFSDGYMIESDGEKRRIRSRCENVFAGSGRHGCMV